MLLVFFFQILNAVFLFGFDQGRRGLKQAVIYEAIRPAYEVVLVTSW